MGSKKKGNYPGFPANELALKNTTAAHRQACHLLTVLPQGPCGITQLWYNNEAQQMVGKTHSEHEQRLAR